MSKAPCVALSGAAIGIVAAGAVAGTFGCGALTGAVFPGLGHFVGEAPVDVALGDLDGDGDIDVATADRDSDSVTLLRNDGRGLLEAWQSIPVGVAPVSVAIGDFNGDGRADLGVACEGEDEAFVLWGGAGETFTPEALALDYEQDDPLAMQAEDADGDGDTDLLVLVEDHVFVLLNVGGGLPPVLVTPSTRRAIPSPSASGT